MNKLTTDQLQRLTNEANEFMQTSGRKLFPPSKIDELAAYGAKRCGRCTDVKHLEEFGKDSSARDGLKFRCRTCDSARNTDYYQRNTDKVLEQKRGYRAANRERINKHMRSYREENRERIREYKRTRRATDEIYRLREQLRSGYRRAVAAGNPAEKITPEQLLSHWEQRGIDPLVCYLTGDPLTPFDRSLDHVVAISNGGEHTVENLMPCTWAANDKKKNLTADEAKEKINA